MSVYHISFDTNTSPGKIKAVRVTIEEVEIALEDTVNIALVDDPLYPRLRDHVEMNADYGR